MNLINMFRSTKIDLHAFVPFNVAEGDFSFYSKKYINTEGVAILSLYGVLNNSFPIWGSSYSDMKRLIVEANKDETVKSVLFKIDSSGGSVSGLQDLIKAIQTSKKEINAYVVGSCLSAAYWIASSCKKITVSEGAVIGSIGTMIASKDNEGEITTIVSKYTERKNASISEDTQQYQDLVDAEAERFLKHVAKARGFGRMNTEDIAEKTGSGKIMTFKEALDRNLVDAVEQENIFNINNGGNIMKTEKTAEVEAVQNAQVVASGTSAETLHKIQSEAREVTLVEERKRILTIAKLSGVSEEVIGAISNGIEAGDYAIAKLEAANTIAAKPAEKTVDVLAEEIAQVNAVNIPDSAICTEEKPVDIQALAKQADALASHL